MSTLETLRKQINQIDAEIIEKLAERQNIVRQVGEFKAKTQQAVLDENREAELMKYYETLCQEHDLDAEWVKDLFKVIITHSKDTQKRS